MDSITIRVKDLYDRVKELKDDKMDYVEISFLEPDEMPDGDIIPASINFSAWTEKESFIGIDYEGIDAIEQVE